MGGSAFQPGFPHPHPTESYWQSPPHALAYHRTTANLPSTTFDYIIIGSGISGTATAYKLLSRDASLKILMLEARTAASGASGRNAGACRQGWWNEFAHHVEKHGEDEAVRFAVLEDQNVKDTAEFVRREGVDCDFREVETADVYRTEEGFAEAVRTVKLREEVLKKRGLLGGEGLQILTVRTGAEASEFLGIPDVEGCVSYSCYTQNPYHLVCHMLSLALEKGLNLQNTTAATRIVKAESEDSDIWHVETDRGTVTGKKVVLATNAYTNALHPSLGLSDFLVPARSQVAALRPGAKMEKDSRLRLTCNMADVPTGEYFHQRLPGLRDEGAMIFGGAKSLSQTGERGTTDDSVLHPVIGEYLRHGAHENVWGSERWGEEGHSVHDWCGIVAYTPDGFPLVGEIPTQKGLWTSVGMNGHGMAMAIRSAEALVEMMTGKGEPEWFPGCFRVERALGTEGKALEWVALP